jgi:membrane protease YdiL (CAAX protease family)
MILHPYLRRSFLAIFLISAFFSILSLFSIQYQFSLWEFFIDGRIAAVAIVVAAAWKQGRIIIDPKNPSMFRFDWKRNAALFFLPLLFYSLSITGGLVSGTLSIDPLDNAATLVLGTLFDIPAIFTFSITTILLEEILFRGIFLPSFRQHVRLRTALLLTNVLWVIYCLPEIFSIPGITLIQGIVTGFFFFSLGLFCSMTAIKTNSVWTGYSFRVGIVSLTPILLTSMIAESDSFFSTQSIIFNAEGLVVSMILILVSFIVLRRSAENLQNSGIRNLS